MATAPGAPPSSDTAFDRALAAIEAELGVVFGDADRVAAACAVLRHDGLAWESSDHLDRLRRLVPVAATAPAALAQPLLDLVREATLHAADPWPLVRALLGWPGPDTVYAALDDALALVERGALRLDDGLIAAVADAVERGSAPLREPGFLEKVARLLRHASGSDATLDPVAQLFTGTDDSAVRCLAARVLDLSGAPPAADVVAGILGKDAARALGPLFAYTRATHLDIAQLARDGAAAVVEAVSAAERQMGSDLARDVIATLEWPRLNRGLAVRPLVGMSVEESLPFLVSPAEARLFDEVGGAERAFERYVVVALGGVTPGAGWSTPESATRDNAEVVRRFRAYNLAHAEVLGHILDIAPLGVERVETILALMDRVTADFQFLFGSRSSDCEALGPLYADLKAHILREVEKVRGGAPLSAELTRLVLMFEDPPALADVRTLHGLKRYLHQRGLMLGFGLLEQGSATNRTVDLLVASPERVLRVERRIEYVDFEPADQADEAHLPYAVEIVAQGFARQMLGGGVETFPSVKVFLYGNEVHYYVTFRNHPAFIRIDFSPPLAGGMIDLQYYGVSKYELENHPSPELEAIQAFFRRIDFDVDVRNTRIHARYDKERAVSLADICEKAEALFRLAPYLMDADWVIGQLALSSQARQAVGHAWADLFARWGTLPVRELLTRDRCGIVTGTAPHLEGRREVTWCGRGPYQDRFTGRPSVEGLSALRDAAARRLPDLRLPERSDVAGQIPMETFVLRPLRAAVERGELVETPEGLTRAHPDLFERLSPPRLFARLLAGPDEALAEAARLAALVGALERSLRLLCIGSVNGYDVQEAMLELRGETLSVYGLRDSSGIIRLAFFSPGGAPAARRVRVHDPWAENVSTDTSELARRLRRNNFLPSWVDAPDGAGPLEVRVVRESFSLPNPRARPRAWTDDRLIAGLRASPGRAVGLARLGTEGRTGDDLRGGVVIAPSVGPPDNALIFAAAGVLCTGGGILSHAGLLAVQFRKPALIVDGTWRRTPGEPQALVVHRTEYEEREAEVDGYGVIERRAIREGADDIRDGDVVELDADASTVRFFGQGSDALGLTEGLRQLHEADLELARAVGDTDILASRGRRLRALHQLARLLKRVDDGPLARHAARQLVAGAAQCGSGGDPAEFARLLRVLVENPRVGPGVTRYIGELARESGNRERSARRAAVDLSASARDGAEVLSLRLMALRARDAAAAARALVEEQMPVLPEGIDLDSVAGTRLATLWRQDFERLRAAPPAEARHLLRQLWRLVRFLDLVDADRDYLHRRQVEQAAADAATVAECSDRHVLWPDDGGIELQPLTGWKAANLAEVRLLAGSALTPPWFVVTDRAFQEALASPVSGSDAVTLRGQPRRGRPCSTLGDAIACVLAAADASNAEKAEAIRRLWTEVRLPSGLTDAVAEAYHALAREDDPREDGRPYVAVRSSAREEDAEAAPRPGEFDTFLFIRDEAAVVEYLKRAWSGLWSERAIHNRSALGLAPSGEGGGVLVQRIAWARLSGVLQTVNVAENERREMVINVGLGMGEGIVSGAVGADHVVVSKEGDLTTSPLRFRYMTCDKRQRVEFDRRTGLGTLRVDVPSHQRFRPALEYVELLELAQLAVRLEGAFGFPLDIEFCFEGTALRVLQVRPVPGALDPWRDTMERYPLERVAVR